jgi:ribosomal protein uL24
LDKPLRTKLNRRSLEVRKNDEVKVMRGKFAKKSGKVLTIDRKKSRIQIDGIVINKKDGEKVGVWFHASNIKITKIDDSDKKRIKKKEQKKEKKNESKTKETTQSKEK